MKKLLLILLSLFIITGCQSKVELNNTYTIEFYSVTTCSECIAFKKNAIPYLTKKSENIKIKMYDLDDDDDIKRYNRIVDHLRDFDEEYYGMGPFIYINGYYAYLGYNSGDEEKLLEDIINIDQSKTLEERDNRYIYKK